MSEYRPSVEEVTDHVLNLPGYRNRYTAPERAHMYHRVAQQSYAIPDVSELQRRDEAIQEQVQRLIGRTAVPVVDMLIENES